MRNGLLRIAPLAALLLLVSAAGSPASAATAPEVTLSTVNTASNQSLRVDIDPDAGNPWKFVLQRKSGGAWRSLGPFTTIGAYNRKDFPASPGTYRVFVPAQNGYDALASAEYTYAPEPVVLWSGQYSLIFDVEPNQPSGSLWTITLETQGGSGDWSTRSGWTWQTGGSTRSITAATGLEDGGVYRLRVARNGRFQAYTSPAYTYYRP